MMNQKMDYSNKINKIGIALIDCMAMKMKAELIKDEAKKKDINSQVDNIYESLNFVNGLFTEITALKCKINQLMSDKIEMEKELIRMNKEVEFNKPE
jgi:predicted RNase H-like nuclease (RuvC/YqgF family)